MFVFFFFPVWKSMKNCFLFGFFQRQGIPLFTVRHELDSPRGQKTPAPHFSMNQSAEQQKVKSSGGLQTLFFYF